MIWMIGYLGAGAVITSILGRHGHNQVAAKKTVLLAMISPARRDRSEGTPNPELFEAAR